MARKILSPTYNEKGIQQKEIMLPIFESTLSETDNMPLLVPSKKILNLFEEPIQIILKEICQNMNNLIKETLQSWHKNIFPDPLPSLSQENLRATYQLLDKIFNTETVKNEDQESIHLMNKMLLAQEICKECFKTKLNLKNLFPSQPKIKLNDLLESTHFSHFLAEKGLLSETDKTHLIELKWNEINLPWVSYSPTAFFDEKIRYKSLFSTLVLEFIIKTIEKEYPSLTEHLKESKSKKPPSICPPTNPSLSKKLINQYFLGTDPRRPFLLDSIQKIFTNREYSKAYGLPFLNKSIPDLKSLMIIHCNPLNAPYIFKKLIWEHRDESWAKSCLELMFAINPEALQIIGKQIKSDPDFMTICQWLSFQSPSIVIKWIDQDIIKSQDLTQKKPFNSTLYQLAKTHPKKFETWIVDKKFSTQQLLKFKDNDKNTIFHIVSKYNPSYLHHWMKHLLLTPQQIEKERTSKEPSILHNLVESGHTDIINAWIEDPLIQLSVKDLGKIFLNTKSFPYPKSVLELLIEYHSSYIPKWVENKLISPLDLLEITRGDGQCTLYSIAQQDQALLRSWINDPLIELSLSHLEKTKKGKAILRFLSQTFSTILNQRSNSLSTLNRYRKH